MDSYNVKHKPPAGAELPWINEEGNPTAILCGPEGTVFVGMDTWFDDQARGESVALYAVHSANAYPKLVERIRSCQLRFMDAGDGFSHDELESFLRELGEL